MTTHATLASALGAACRHWPDRAAIEWNGRGWTYRDLARTITELASQYARRGVQPGDRVACRLPICPAHLAAVGAAWACGAVHVGLDHELTPPELAALIALTSPTVLVSEAGPRSVPDVSGPRTLLVEPGSALVDAEAPARAALHVAAPEDPAVVFPSSGTTGTPKAAVSLHGNLVRRWSRLAGAFGLRPQDVHLAQLPLAHGYGLMTAMIGLLTGGRLVLLSPFRPAAALDAIESAAVSVIHGSPAHYARLLEQLAGGGYRLERLRTGSGSAAYFPPALVREILDQLPIDFMLMYGASEGVGVGTMNRDDLLRGAVGRPTGGAVEIHGPDGRPVRRGEVGEIVFSRREFPVRYWGVAATTEEADGWYRSGDLGRLDGEGRLYVLGRLAQRINRGGLKIDPHEVEQRLATLPSIAEVAVVGCPHPQLGEVVCACVVARPGSTPELGAIRRALGRTLAHYKLPERLCILDRLPRRTTGKVDLRALQRAAAGAP